MKASLEGGIDRRVESRKRTALFGVIPPSSGVATYSVGAEGQTGSAARLIASLEAEAYGTWQQAFAEVYGR